MRYQRSEKVIQEADYLTSIQARGWPAAINPWQIAPDFPNDPNIPKWAKKAAPNTAFTDRPLIEHVRAAARRDGQRIAIDDGAEKISYTDLVVRAESLAARLLEATSPDEAIGLLLPNSVSLHISILACLTAGRPYIAMDLTSPPTRNQRIIERSGLRTTIVDGLLSEAAGNITGDIQQINLRQINAKKWIDRDEGNPPSTDRPAIILFTSGSTGEPKGVVNSERAVLERVRQYIHSGDFDASDVFLPLSSACTIAGTRECFTALSLGATLVLASPEAKGLHGIREQIVSKKVTVLNGVPAVLRALMSSAPPETKDFASIQMIKVGGDRVLWTDIDLFRAVCNEKCRIQAGYSSTETTATYWEIPKETRVRGETVAAGYLHSSVAYRILTDDGQNAALGQEGELVIKSPFVAMGLWQEGHLIEGSMKADPFDPAQRIFHTGDLVRQLPSGMIEIIGRKDRQVKINGKRVEPTELEVGLRTMNGVLDAAVIAVRETDSTKLVAFVTLDERMKSAVDWDTQLRLDLRQVLPAMLNPSRLHALAQIPRLPSGKQDTVSLTAIDQTLACGDAPLNEPYPSDTRTTAIEEVVHRTWRAVLGVNALREDRSWDESGGDSLSLLRFVFLLENDFGRSFSLPKFRMDMRPSDVTILVRNEASAPSPIPQATNQPILFLFPGLTGDSPSLASFRNDLSEHARVVLIPYPDWRAMALGAERIFDLVQTALAVIRREAPEGRLFLIGYSLGGVVAYETAVTLYEEGRDIAYLSILDNNISANAASSKNLIVRLQKILFDRSHDRLTVLEKLIEQTGNIASHPALRRGLAWLARKDLSRFSPLLRFNLRNAVWEALQTRALIVWCNTRAARRLPLHASVFVSEEVRAGAEPDLGWGSRFSSIAIDNVSGDHRGMLRSPHRAMLVDKVVRALSRAVVG